MAKGASGRIVVQVEPLLKRELHSALALEGQTLKSWFVEAAEAYISGRSLLNGSYTKKLTSVDLCGKTISLTKNEF